MSDLTPGDFALLQRLGADPKQVEVEGGPFRHEGAVAYLICEMLSGQESRRVVTADRLAETRTQEKVRIASEIFAKMDGDVPSHWRSYKHFGVEVCQALGVITDGAVEDEEW